MFHLEVDIHFFLFALVDSRKDAGDSFFSDDFAGSCPLGVIVGYVCPPWTSLVEITSSGALCVAVLVQLGMVVV